MPTPNGHPSGLPNFALTLVRGHIIKLRNYFDNQQNDDSLAVRKMSDDDIIAVPGYLDSHTVHQAGEAVYNWLHRNDQPQP